MSNLKHLIEKKLRFFFLVGKHKTFVTFALSQQYGTSHRPLHIPSVVPNWKMLLFLEYDDINGVTLLKSQIWYFMCLEVVADWQRV